MYIVFVFVVITIVTNSYTLIITNDLLKLSKAVICRIVDLHCIIEQVI